MLINASRLSGRNRFTNEEEDKLCNRKRQTSKPRTRKKTTNNQIKTTHISQKMKKLPRNLPTLNQFMLRREVIQLYRDIFRAIRKVPDENSRNELKAWTRSDFRANMNHTDEITIKMLIQQGKRSLNELTTSLNLSGASKT